MISSTPKFTAASKFWSIQRAFMSADTAAMETLLGSGMKHEITSGLTPSESEIENMSYITILENHTEISVRYDFTCDGVDAAQVWHFELEGDEWVLNGLENLDI